MKQSVWSKAIRNAADPKRARHFFDQLAQTDSSDTVQKALPEFAAILASVFSGSQALSSLLLSHPEWLTLLQPDTMRFARRKEGFVNEIEAWVHSLLQGHQYDQAVAKLRLFKQREMLRIGARDLSQPGNAEQVIQELSDLADVCLDTVWHICRLRLIERHGKPWHQDANGKWHPTNACVIGLGKLGGQELNYSSDVDVVFLFTRRRAVFSVRRSHNQSPGALGTTRHSINNRH